MKSSPASEPLRATHFAGRAEGFQRKSVGGLRRKPLGDNIKKNMLPETTQRYLRELRSRMLYLHKILLEMERADFERVSGRLNSGELLQLVINHEKFAWLRQISALVVQIDETLDEKERAMVDDLPNLLGQAQSLVTSSTDKTFREKYEAALQRSPEAVMAHSEVAKLLRENQPPLRFVTEKDL